MEMRFSLLSNNETMVADSDFTSQLSFAQLFNYSTLGMKKPRPHFLRLDSTGENMDHISYPNFYNNYCNTSVMTKSIVGGFIGSKSCRQEYSQALQPSYCRKRTNNTGSWGFSNFGESNCLSDFVNCFSALVLEEDKCPAFNNSVINGLNQNFMNTHLLNVSDDPSKPLNKISAPSNILDAINQKQAPGMINDCNKRTKESSNDVLNNIVNKNCENVQVEHSEDSDHVDLAIPKIKEPQQNTSLAAPICKNEDEIGDLHGDMNLIKELFSEDVKREKIFRKKKHKDICVSHANSSLNSKNDVLLTKDILTDITKRSENDQTFTENIADQNEKLPKPKTSYNFCLNIPNSPNKTRKKRRKKRLKCKTVATAEVNSNFIISEKNVSGSFTQTNLANASNTKELWDEPVSECKKSRLERPVCQNAIVRFILGCDSDISDSEEQNSDVTELNDDDPWDELDSVFTINYKQINEENESTLQRRSDKPKKQVHFAEGDDLTTVYMIMLWDRKGPWEKYGLDRCRFERRIQDVEKTISYCFEPAHRLKIYQKYHQEL